MADKFDRFMRKVRRALGNKGNCIFFGIVSSILCLISCLNVSLLQFSLFLWFLLFALFFELGILCFGAAKDCYEPISLPKPVSLTPHEWLVGKMMEFEVKLMDRGEIVTVKKKLTYLKELYEESYIDDALYIEQKEYILALDLGEHWERIDLNVLDEKEAYKRKLNYLNDLLQAGLISAKDYYAQKEDLELFSDILLMQ